MTFIKSLSIAKFLEEIERARSVTASALNQEPTKSVSIYHATIFYLSSICSLFVTMDSYGKTKLDGGHPSNVVFARDIITHVIVFSA